MVVKSGFDVYLEKQNAKKTLYKIEDEINLLANLVSNQEFDDRFDSAVVSFKMFLEKIKDDSLQRLVKDLHDVQFGYDVYSGNNGQESYIKQLKNIYNTYVRDELNSASKNMSDETKRTNLSFLRGKDTVKE